jgi:hypothetical protein
MGTDDLYPNTLHYVMVFMNLYNGHVEFAEQAPVDPPTIITSWRNGVYVHHLPPGLVCLNHVPRLKEAPSRTLWFFFTYELN